MRRVTSYGALLSAVQGMAPHNAHISDGFVNSMLDVAEFPYSFIMPAFRDPMLPSFGNLHRYSVPSFSSGCDQSLQFFSLKFYTFPFLSFVLVLIFRVGFSLISLRAFLF